MIFKSIKNVLFKGARDVQRLNATISKNPVKCEEIRIKLPWGFLAGKWWGPQDKRPILCIHGWQDNSGTFDQLIPWLPDNVGYLTIDMPGHGLSSQLPDGVYYHGIDTTIMLRRLQSYFEWPKISLMGHSMGGILSFLHTCVFPETIDMLVCIDALKPFSQVPGGHIKSVVRNVDAFIYYDNLNRGHTKPPTYSYDEIVQKLHLGTRKSIAVENCKYILERSIVKSDTDEGKYYFSRDSRLKTGTLMGLMHDDLLEHAKRVTVPHLVIKATRSPYFEDKKYFYDVIEVLKNVNRDFEYHRVEGTHHVHLNEPEKVASLISPFIVKHDTSNRKVGGIKPEMKIS